MAHLRRESSNSLFEILEGWEAYLQAENIDFAELSQETLYGVSEKHQSLSLTPLPIKPENPSPRLAKPRKRLRRPQP